MVAYLLSCNDYHSHRIETQKQNFYQTIYTFFFFEWLKLAYNHLVMVICQKVHYCSTTPGGQWVNGNIEPSFNWSCTYKKQLFQRDKNISIHTITGTLEQISCSGNCKYWFRTTGQNNNIQKWEFTLEKYFLPSGVTNGKFAHPIKRENAH